MSRPKATIIGPAIIDVMAGPIGDDLFKIGTMPMQDIHMTYGGNGYNEAADLAHLGVDVNLIGKLGNDEAGIKVLNQIKSLGINTKHIILEDDLTTSINVVLFDADGERRFLTNPSGSQRKFTAEDVDMAIGMLSDGDSAIDLSADENTALNALDDVVCFSCMFVSPAFDIAGMERTFARIKAKPERTLVVDMTKAKNSETIDDLKNLLPYIDYLLPNEAELKLIGGEDIDAAAKKLLDYGVGCVVVKVGAKGCNVYTKQETFNVQAYKIDKPVDTTGAGDSFVAGFIYGLLTGKSLKDCARFGNAVASCIVEKVGATEGLVSIEEPMRRFEDLQ